MKWNEWYLVEIKNSEESWLMIALFNAVKIAEGNFATHKDLFIVFYPAFILNEQVWFLHVMDIALYNPPSSRHTCAWQGVLEKPPLFSTCK